MLDRPLAEQRHSFDREKWDDAAKLRKRDQEIGAIEAAAKAKEQGLLATGRNRWLNPLVVAVCVAIISVAGTALVACNSTSQRPTDAPAVRDISSQLAAVSNDWNDLVRDLVGSCDRERSINPILKDCGLERKASDGIIAANEMLRDYLMALKAAATETNFTVQPGLDKVIESVAAIPNIDKAQLTAVSGLVGLLAKLSVEKMRADTLGVLIGAGPAAQTIIDGLNQLVVPRLRSRLGAEKTQLTGYFVVAILRQRDPVGSDPEALCSGSAASKFSGTGLLLAREYCNQVASLGNKLKLLDKYETSLKAASKALTELQSASRREAV